MTIKDLISRIPEESPCEALSSIESVTSTIDSADIKCHLSRKFKIRVSRSRNGFIIKNGVDSRDCDAKDFLMELTKSIYEADEAGSTFREELPAETISYEMCCDCNEKIKPGQSICHICGAEQ